MPEPLIEAVGLSKSYRLGQHRIAAVADVNLTIAAGEFVAIMGPSGSGKSTFMNLLGCLDAPTAGRYLLDGVDVRSKSGDTLAAIRNRKIGFVFQNFSLLPHVDVLANVALPMVYAGTRRRDRLARARSLLEAVGLAHRADHRPSQLSGGEQQRAAIARAIANDPRLVLADEPTGMLDTATSHEIMALFQRLNRTGITIVLVTHEPDIARCAQRIVVFRDGRIADDTTAADVIQFPAPPQARHAGVSP